MHVCHDLPYIYFARTLGAWNYSFHFPFSSSIVGDETGRACRIAKQTLLEETWLIYLALKCL